MLFFDDLHGAAAEVQRTQAAAKRFIKEGMGPGARAAIYAASEGLTLDFTADADALTTAIGKLRAHQRRSSSACGAVRQFRESPRECRARWP